MSSPPASKSELLARAIDALGPDAKYPAVRERVLAEHGVTVSKSAFYDEKKRRQSGSTPPALPDVKPIATPAPAAPVPTAKAPATIALKDPPELMRAARELSDRLGGKETLKQFLDAL